MKAIDSVKYYTKQPCTRQQAALHIGMYLAWVFQRGMSSFRTHGKKRTINDSFFQRRTGSFIEIVINNFNGDLREKDLSTEGLIFTRTFYKQYRDIAFARLLATSDTNRWKIKDNWRNFDLVCELLDTWATSLHPKPESIFQTDELDICQVKKDWSSEEILSQKGLFYLKDIRHSLGIQEKIIQKHNQHLIEQGKDPYKVMGVRKVWNHWMVRMKVFSPYYRKNISPLARPLLDDWSITQEKQPSEIYQLNRVTNRLEISSTVIRYHARNSRNSKKEIGVWKCKISGIYLVKLDIFIPWLKNRYPKTIP